MIHLKKPYTNKKIQTQIVVIFFLFSLLFAGSVFTNNLFKTPERNTIKTNDFLNIFPYTSMLINNSSDPITLDGNAEVDTFFNGDPGDGLSWATAYHIQNLVIDGDTSHAGGIYIKNSDRYVIIENCSVKLEGSMLEDNGAIFILNSANVRIQNCTTEGYRNTIFIKNSENIQVYNNTAKNGIEDGIHLIYSRNCILDGNQIFGNNWYGICLKFTNDTTATENHIYENNHEGIYVTENDNLTLTWNILQDNTAYGINFKLSDNSYIANNTYSNNGYGPIMVSGGINNQILDEEYEDLVDTDDTGEDDDDDQNSTIPGGSFGSLTLLLITGILIVIIRVKPNKNKS